MFADLVFFGIHPDSVSLTLPESLLQHVAIALKVFLEGIAILIIAVSAVRMVLKLLRRLELVRCQQDWNIIRLDLGISLALALEFLLAADIVGTAISPSWEALGKLAAVTGIRIVLNIFLHKEVKQLESTDYRCLNRQGTQRKQIHS